MKTFKVKAIQKVTSVGWYEAETEAEAIAMFDADSVKLDYSTGYPLGYLTSGYNPVAEVVENANV